MSQFAIRKSALLLERDNLKNKQKKKTLSLLLERDNLKKKKKKKPCLSC